jgi:acyl phosphate:glycerol-3-phosphate acyltransferase
MTALIAIAAVVGYLLGSIPFGLVLTRAFGVGDIRKIGSGNIGATNVLRTGNKSLAAATLALDGLKGTAAVLTGSAVAYRFNQSSVELFDDPIHLAAMAGGLGAFLGHLFPIWLAFKGGKGVATYGGIVLGLMWPLAIVGFVVWVLIAAVTRYSSAAALVAGLALPPAALVIGGGVPLAGLLALMSVLLIWKHGDNIKRLLSGTESRIGQKG